MVVVVEVVGLLLGRWHIGVEGEALQRREDW